MNPNTIIAIGIGGLIMAYILYKSAWGKKGKMDEDAFPEEDVADLEPVHQDIVEVEADADKKVKRGNLVKRILNFRKKQQDGGQPTGEDTPAQTATAADGKIKKEKTTIYAPIYAYILNNVKGRCGPARLTGKQVGEIYLKYKSIGTPRLMDDGKMRYRFVLDRDGFHPVSCPVDLVNSANRLWQAQQHPEVPLFVEADTGDNAKQRMWLYFALAAVAIFLMWSAAAG